jgi:1-acyl-sn-glycerol-3-phosphate acyltransferase
MRTLLAYAAIAGCTIFFGGIVVLATAVGIKPKPNGVLEQFPRWFSRVVMRATGSPVVVRNADVIVPGEAHICVANHVSWFDVFALASVLPRYRFVAKQELRKVPIFGTAAGQVAAIYIDRQNRKAAFDTYKEAVERVRTGLNVVVYPEGTRGRSYELRPFKKGPFVLAIAAGVPIVPVVIHGTREIQAKESIRVRRGVAEITFLEPVPTAGLTYDDRDALMRTVWHRMADALEQLHGVRSTGAEIAERDGRGRAVEA